MKTHLTYFVLCPENHVTGGTEALHQLADALNAAGRRAYMAYLPLGSAAAKAPAFAQYEASPAAAIDDKNSVIIVGETATGLLRQFPKSRKVVWWLSFDFYYDRTFISVPRDIISRIQLEFKRRNLPLRQLRQYLNVAQSTYAKTALARKHVNACTLSDYINSGFLVEPGAGKPRTHRILYNPQKGINITKMLMAAIPDQQFVPLTGYTREALRDLLLSSSLYIDFGHHPGKDRMPREAALAGCCVITGRRGSAAFDDDLPIPAAYRIDETSPGFIEQVRMKSSDIQRDFDSCAREFEPYRNFIKGERQRFFDETRRLVQTVEESCSSSEKV